MATNSTRMSISLGISDAKDAKCLSGNSAILNEKCSYLSLCMTLG